MGKMIEILCEDPRWRRLQLEEVAQVAVDATLSHLALDPEVCEIAILACDDARITTLNAEFRGKTGATNVLSWPAQELSPPGPPQVDPDGTVPLGDLALAFDTCAREAADQGKTLSAHATHLIVHGTLHLLGYDHLGDREATQMERLEVEILCNLGLADPYS